MVICDNRTESFIIFFKSLEFAKNFESISPLTRPVTPLFIKPTNTVTAANTIDFIIVAFLKSL